MPTLGGPRQGCNGYCVKHLPAYATRDYLKSVHYKLDCATSAQAVTKAIKLGLLTV